MKGGVKAIDFAIRNVVLCELLGEQPGVELKFRPLASADAGKSNTYRLLPFIEEADDVEGYLQHDCLWFVTPRNITASALLWIPKSLSQKRRTKLGRNEVLISISGVIPRPGPTDLDQLAMRTTIPGVLSLGARRL